MISDSKRAKWKVKRVYFAAVKSPGPHTRGCSWVERETIYRWVSGLFLLVLYIMMFTVFRCDCQNAFSFHPYYVLDWLVLLPSFFGHWFSDASYVEMLLYSTTKQSILLNYALYWLATCRITFTDCLTIDCSFQSYWHALVRAGQPYLPHFLIFGLLFTLFGDMLILTYWISI